MLNLNTISLLAPSFSFKEDGNPGKSLLARLGFTFGSFVDQTLALTPTRLQISGYWDSNNLVFEIMNKKNASTLIIILKTSIFAASFFYFPIPSLTITSALFIIKHLFKKTINDTFVSTLEILENQAKKGKKIFSFSDEFGYFISIIKNKHPEWTIIPEVEFPKPYDHKGKAASYIYFDKETLELRNKTIEDKFKSISSILQEFIDEKNTTKEIGIDFKQNIDEVDFTLLNKIKSSFPSLELKQLMCPKSAYDDHYAVYELKKE